MDQAEMERSYERLKIELAQAYSSFTWDSSHIDQLARELIGIERLARIQDNYARMEDGEHLPGNLYFR